MFDIAPCVFLVGRGYQIFFHTQEKGLAWIEVAGREYLDEKGGLLRSETTVHRACVPCEALDAAREYTVCFRPLAERKYYFSEPGPVERRTWPFRPAWHEGELRIMQIGDTHSCVGEGVAVGTFFGEDMDLLVMNGDILIETSSLEGILAIYEIAAGITHGERPVVFLRGNHDMRGSMAADLPDYIGTDEGRTFFTFRTGGLWGIVLDCGEDKGDESPEYGGVSAGRLLRRRQTAFLRQVLENKEREFAAPGVELRLAFCHIPFMTDLMAHGPRFDIERELFAEWTRLLGEMGIELMLCAHQHHLYTYPVGAEGLRYGARFPVIVGTEPHFPPTGDTHPSIGTAVTIDRTAIHAVFTDGRGRTFPAMEIQRG